MMLEKQNKQRHDMACKKGSGHFSNFDPIPEHTPPEPKFNVNVMLPPQNSAVVTKNTPGTSPGTQTQNTAHSTGNTSAGSTPNNVAPVRKKKEPAKKKAKKATEPPTPTTPQTPIAARTHQNSTGGIPGNNAATKRRKREPLVDQTVSPNLNEASKSTKTGKISSQTDFTGSDNGFLQDFGDGTGPPTGTDDMEFDFNSFLNNETGEPNSSTIHFDNVFNWGEGTEAGDL